MRNPKVDRLKVLGITVGQFNAAVADLTAFLLARDIQGEVDEAQARAALSAPVSDRVWNEIKKDLGV